MKLIALLSWYDEPVWALTELVASLARAGCDHLVAVDGAYALFPEARAQSPGEQAQALLAAAQGAGMGVCIHVPQEVWFGNELEKRTFLFAAGHQVAEPGEDWLWVCDADEVILEAIGLRERLEATEHDVAEVILRMNENGDGGLEPIRKLFRAQQSGIFVRTNHFTYQTGDGRLLWEGHLPPKPVLVGAETMHFVRVDHRRTRKDRRLEDRQRYYDRRKEHGIELVPG